MAARFDWVRRMGVHEAYHRSYANRLVHWFCIPVELFCAIKLLSLAPFEIALPVIGAVGLLYMLAEPLAGVLMTAALVGLRFAAPLVTIGTVWLDALLAAGVFAIAFSFQTRVGHGKFEEGRDDTEMNIAELKRTLNPVPILLVFYYHLVEILFAIGYRPALRSQMEAHMAAELARIGAASGPRR